MFPGVIYHRNETFGYDVFYSSEETTWGYSAVALSHVTLSMVPVSQLRKILDRPEYATVKQTVRRNSVFWQVDFNEADPPRYLFQTFFRQLPLLLKTCILRPCSRPNSAQHPRSDDTTARL